MKYFLCLARYGMAAGLVWAGSTSLLAISIQFDYRYDSSGFFAGANAYRRQVLDLAARTFEQRINDSFSAIVPSGINTWSLSFTNPATGLLETLKDPVVAADTVTIYTGARDLTGNLLGYAEYRYSWYGDNATWGNLFRSRDSASNFDSFGGSIAFDNLSPWYFDTDVSTIESFPNQYDFYSVALHEIGHLLGFTYGANAFRDKISGSDFTGPQVEALNGGPAPLAGDLNHWQEGLTYGHQEVSMDPTFNTNTRKYFTELDFAALEDIGCSIAPAEANPIIIHSISRNGAQVLLAWSGGRGPYQVQQRRDDGTWQNAGSQTSLTSATVTSAPAIAIFRVAGQTN